MIGLLERFLAKRAKLKELDRLALRSARAKKREQRALTRLDETLEGALTKMAEDL